MKVGIIGTGSIGRRHLKNLIILKDELSIKEIRCFDNDPERLKQIKKEYPEILCPTTLNEAVEDVDAAFVCVPTSIHIPIISEILRSQNMHLYLEKPFSHTLKGCEELIFSQKQQKKILAVGYMLQHHPVLQKVKEILVEKKLGRILSVRAESGFYLPKWHPWEDYRDFYMSWKTGGGGALLDSSHEINYLQWLFGDIVEVKGYMDKVSDLEITSDDLVTSIFQFKNRIIGQLHLDLLQFDESRFCKIIGTEGVLKADLTQNLIKYNKKDDQEWKEIKLDVNFDEIYYTQLREFFKACRGEDAHIIAGEEALKTMQVIEAIRRSHAYSATVKLPFYN